jgi:hypothetical protein
MKMLMNPKPFYTNKNKLKAFVLDADPTNPDKKQFELVFGINSGDKRYFASIERNLTAVGLTIKDVYVENLVQEYLNKPTAENEIWEKDADRWLPVTKKDLDEIDPSGRLPVFVTAERIMKFLYPETPKATEIFSGLIKVPFARNNNKLGRPVIPLYGHFKYNLSNHIQYKNLLIIIFNTGLAS